MFLSILNNFIGAQYLIGSGNGKYYSKAFIICAITTLILFFILIKAMSFKAIIIGSNLGELMLTLVMIYYIKFRIKNNSSLL
jgi:O-antigen/teichoic acid export membrane protein